MIQLEKYHGSRSRFACPKCQVKNAFVRYQNEHGEYIGFDVGRCNRESSCGYHKKPKDFFAENVFTQKMSVYGNQKQIEANYGRSHKNGAKQHKNRKFNYLKPTSLNVSQNREAATKKDNHLSVVFDNLIEIGKPLANEFIEEKYLINSLKNYEQNNFVYFLETLFSEQEVKRLIDRFAIGTDESSKTVFWQIDHHGRIHTGRIMLFDKLTGKRSKVVHQNWIHSVLQKKGLLENFELKQCLYGEHQLAFEDEQQKPIAIVEADKTAVIASSLMPEFVWMSAGAKSYLNAEKLKPLSNRKVILFPDTNAFDDWTEKSKEIRSVVPSLKVSDYLETRLTETEKREGYDIADFLISQRQKEVWERELYNRKVDAIKADEKLLSGFNFLIEERKAVMMFDGNMSEIEAENIIYLPENIQPFVLNMA